MKYKQSAECKVSKKINKQQVDTILQNLKTNTFSEGY